MIMVAAPNVASMVCPSSASAHTSLPTTRPVRRRRCRPRCLRRLQGTGGTRRPTAVTPPTCGSAPPSTSLWYSFTPSSGGPAWFNVVTPPPFGPPGAAVYTVSADGQSVQQACSGFTSPGSQAVTLVAGQRYLVMVGPDPLFDSQGAPSRSPSPRCSNGPLNDARVGAVDVPSPLPATVVGDTSTATAEPSDPLPPLRARGSPGRFGTPSDPRPRGQWSLT